jgi:hypothetical protein
LAAIDNRVGVYAALGYSTRRGLERHNGGCRNIVVFLRMARRWMDATLHTTPRPPPSGLCRIAHPSADLTIFTPC